MSSPQTWVAVFDILLCAMNRVQVDGLFTLHSRCGATYSAPDVAYADDMLSFASSLKGLQNKANMVSLSAYLLGLHIATHKLRLMKKIWDPMKPDSLPASESLRIYINDWAPLDKELGADTGVIRALGVTYDLDCSGLSQYRASLAHFQQTINALSWHRCFPETVLYAIEASGINQIAYPGVLSSWSKRQCTAFDEILAVELRTRSKNLRSQQTEHLFQPKSHCGLGFHRVSSILQERKRALIDRALQSDLFTCRAMEAMLDRAGVNWTSGAAVGSLDAFQSG